VELKANVVPVRKRLRRYPPRQAAFLAHYCAELERQGYVQKTHRAQWIAAPNIVPKPGPSQFRLTVDSRPINRATVPIIWSMPHLESALASFRGATCFAKVNLSAGYYQIAVHESCQDLFAFITPQGVYAPTRLLQGSRNAAAYFQMCIHNALVDANLYWDVIQWLDDIIFHADSEDALLKVLESFFSLWRRFGLFSHAGKCDFFARDTTFCGRLLSAAGIVFDPRRLTALRTMSTPVTGADLQQFLCALGWMRKGIPDYFRRTQPLLDVLEEVYHLGGGRTRRHASRVRLTSSSWGPAHNRLFQELQQHRLIKLAHYDSERKLCLYEDASMSGWPAVLTQVPVSEMRLPHAERNHQPLAFLSGCFRGASCNWSVIEKEAFAFIRALTASDYFVRQRRGLSSKPTTETLSISLTHWVLNLEYTDTQLQSSCDGELD
jgi:hypothetical protein